MLVMKHTFVRPFIYFFSEYTNTGIIEGLVKDVNFRSFINIFSNNTNDKAMGFKLLV